MAAVTHLTIQFDIQSAKHRIEWRIRLLQFIARLLRIEIKLTVVGS